MELQNGAKLAAQTLIFRVWYIRKPATKMLIHIFKSHKYCSTNIIPEVKA